MQAVARRGRYILGVVTTIVVGGFFALACLGGVIGAASTSSYRSHNSETFGGDIALASVSAVIVLACILVGAHLEHQLRRHQPLAEAWSGVADPTEVSGVRTGARKTRYSPVIMAIYIVFMSAAAIGLAIGAVFTHANAERSSRVQHEGLARTATVVRVENHHHSSRGGGFYTADIFVSLTQPVDGRTRTVVHYPGRVQEPTGAQLSILIDPKDPGYSQLPGSPSTKSWSWILLTVFAVLFAGLDLFVGWVFLRIRRHRRTFYMSAVPHPAAPA